MRKRRILVFKVIRRPKTKARQTESGSAKIEYEVVTCTRKMGRMHESARIKFCIVAIQKTARLQLASPV